MIVLIVVASFCPSVSVPQVPQAGATCECVLGRYYHRQVPHVGVPQVPQAGADGDVVVEFKPESVLRSYTAVPCFGL